MVKFLKSYYCAQNTIWKNWEIGRILFGNILSKIVAFQRGYVYTHLFQDVCWYLHTWRCPLDSCFPCTGYAGGFSGLCIFSPTRSLWCILGCPSSPAPSRSYPVSRPCGWNSSSGHILNDLSEREEWDLSFKNYKYMFYPSGQNLRKSNL